MWIVAAVLSAVFAGLTAVLSKCGVKNTNSDVATAIRTSVVLVFSWFIVLITGALPAVGGISARSMLFLILSGLATGASWIFYFKALSVGEASRVAAVDKSSVVLTVLFALAAFPSERALWQVKLVCLAAIAVGTFLMCDLKKERAGTKATWLIFALLSAVFAATTSVLAKIGVESVNSNVATAVRTCVVFVMAWLIVIIRKETALVKSVGVKEGAFLVLSGLATGASWLFYYYAIKNGQVSVVVPVDKLSIIITVIFSRIAFKEKLSPKSLSGLSLITVGTVCMAIFT